MTLQSLSKFETMTPPSRHGSRLRSRRLAAVEVLERRILLSGPTVYTVNNLSASVGVIGSLPYAIAQANANTNPDGSAIQFSPTVFSSPQTIALGSTLVLSENDGPETIDGPGSNLLTISGSNSVQVFKVSSTAMAALSGLTISGGSSAHNGGGIDNEGSLSLTNVTIADNSVSGGGDGGGIYNNGPLTVTNCTISGNSVSGGGFGGGVANEDNMSMTNSTVSGNSVNNGSGGGIDNENTLLVTACSIIDNRISALNEGAGILNQSNLTVLDSTIANNSGAFDGGGLYNDGTVQVEVLNSTIANNSAANAAGIYTVGTLTVVNSTIADNVAATAGEGGGLLITGGKATLDNSIVAMNTRGTGGATADDIDATGGGKVAPASAFNLIGTGGSGGLTAGVDGNQVGVANPGLGQLANNGGPTQTMALLSGSPAINAGSNSLAVDPATGQALATDQRGPSFVRISNGTVDIGAYELQPATIIAISVGWGTQTAAVQLAADGVHLLPVARSTDVPWAGIDRLTITFNEAATLTAAGVTIQGARGINYGPVTVTGSGMSYTIAFARPIAKSDLVTISIAGSGFNSLRGTLAVLPGDVGGFGRVNKTDVQLARAEVKGTGGTKPSIFADILGTGTVNASDLKYVRRHLGTKLPRPRGPMQSVALARALVRVDHNVRPRRRA